MVAPNSRQPVELKQTPAARGATDLKHLLVHHAEQASEMASLLERVEVDVLRFACTPEATHLQEVTIPWAERLDALRQRLTAEVARAVKLVGELENPAAMQVSRANVAVLMPGSNPADFPKIGHTTGNGAGGGV